MRANNKHNRTLRAILCEIEHGLFYATYPGRAENPDIDELPTYGLGACAAHVKQQMEKSIRQFGYETVIWADALVLPPSHLAVRAPAVPASGDRLVSP
jgi:hypothetical protein